jgi:hypothetical protein
MVIPVTAHSPRLAFLGDVAFRQRDRQFLMARLLRSVTIRSRCRIAPGCDRVVVGVEPEVATTKRPSARPPVARTTDEDPYQLVDLVEADRRWMAELVRRYADRWPGYGRLDRGRPRAT